MSTPIDTLLALNDAERDLDRIQDWIDHVRVVAPTNQIVQLELDRHQTELDVNRARIEFARVYIANSN